MQRIALFRVDPAALSLVLNGALVLLASVLIDGFTVSSIWKGMGVALGLTAINTLLGSLLDNRFCNPATNEVAAFEKLIGPHGGFGGYQGQPFVLYPPNGTQVKMRSSVQRPRAVF